MASEGGLSEDDDALPIGIHALLAARLDRLDVADVQLLSTAAVQGREFASTTVAAMMEGARRAELIDRLVGLESRGFVRRLDEVDERWAFAHGLLRDAAERRLAKAARADLHQRLGDLLDQANAPDDELIGMHLERATRLREELALRDETTAALATRAGIHFARAGTRAFARIDLSTSANLLGRAAALLPETAQERLDLLPDLGVALTELGRPEEAATLLASAVASARASGQETQALCATIQLLSTRLYLRDIDVDVVERTAREVIEALEARGHDAGLAQAWILIDYVHNVRSACLPAVDASLTAISYGRRSGRLREQLQASGDLALYLLWSLAGPARLADAIREVESGDDPVSVVTAEVLRAMAAAWTGDVPGFRSATARHNARLHERGLAWLEATNAATLGMILMQIDERSEAAQLLQGSYETLLRTGDIWWAGHVEPGLALCLDLAGRREEFLAVVARGPMSGLPDDRLTELMWTVVGPRAKWRRGQIDEAVAQSREAAALCAETDVAMLTALAHESLADILLAAGQADEAAEARETAERIYAEGSFEPGIVRLGGSR